MKKLLLLTILFSLILSLISCSAFEVIKFTENSVDYYYEFSDGVKTITNYHPYRFFKLPSYQEMVQYGDGAGLENQGVVYFIYAVDTTVDPESETAYYMAELDGETKELIYEKGEYFTDEASKQAFVERLVNLVDNVYFK